MNRGLLAACVIVNLFAVGQLKAEEQVTLKSGTRLVGLVSVKDNTVAVKIGESEVSFPMSEVDLIGPVGTDVQESPQRLLMISLESRLQHGSGEGQVGLLAEAHRQAPGDARIAYWYARSLLDAGLGTAANDILSEHREGIEKAYPGMTGRLAEQIQERMSLENLPARLIARLDKINTSLGNAPLSSDELPQFVRFRLVDQHGEPIAEKAAIRINARGNDERLEAFDNGYYLYSFNQYRGNNDDDPCELTVSWPGLETKEFELHAAGDSVADSGQLTVKRFDETSKVPLQVVAVDQAGKPVQGAIVTLRPNTERDSRAASPTATTDAEGRAEISAFPMNYHYSVAAKGFKAEGASIDLKAGLEEQRVELYPVITGSVKVAWATTGLQQQGTTFSEGTLSVGEGISPMPYGPDSINFIRPMQVKDRLMLQSGPPFFGGPMVATSPWVHRVPDRLMNGSPPDHFKNIDLKEIDKLKDTSEEVDVEPGPGPPQYSPFSFPVKQGEVYIGQVSGRDMRNGQPTMVSFKVFVEKVASEP